MLEQIIKEGLIEARGIVGFYPCNSSGADEDIQVYDENDLSKVKATFCTLR
jgi:cobalamin-dependent methionine synthase I